MERRIVTTTRECAARLVPTGDPVTIPSGAFITLTQSLGGTFTVILNGNMARIAGMDADAIGLQIEPLEFPGILKVLFVGQWRQHPCQQYVPCCH